MIYRDHRIEQSERTRRIEADRLAAAVRVANAVHALIAGCTAPVVIADHGHEWRLLAQQGPLDASSSWRSLVARRDRDGGSSDTHALVAEIPCAGSRVMLVVTAAPGTQLPVQAEAVVRPIVDAGGVLFGVAGGGHADAARSLPRTARWQLTGSDG